MARNILILNGHPDAASTGLCHALASAYEDDARSAGHAVRRLDAKLDFGLLHSQAAFEKDSPPSAIMAAQESIRWSDHLVVISRCG
jgi:putative NADPH-quinone reductase